MGSWISASCVACVILLAGCAGPVATQGESVATTSVPVGPTTFDAANGTAILRGRVTDQELVPIAGASVDVRSRRDANFAPLGLSTDPEGRFEATGLAAGEYVLYVSARGYQDEPPKIVSASEEPADVVVQLEPLAMLAPFVDLRQYRVQFRAQPCVLTPATPVCVTTYVTTNVTYAVTVDEFANGSLESVVLQSRWQPTVGLCPGGMRTDLYSPGQESIPAPDYRDGAVRSDSNPYHWDNVPEAAKSPTRLFAPRNGEGLAAMHSSERTQLNKGVPIETHGRWGVTLYTYPVGTLGTPVDYSCAIEQIVDVYLAFFYLEPAKPDYSSLP